LFFIHEMTVILGDSNVRQFQEAISSPGFGVIFFSGATIKGLSNSQSHHHAGSLIQTICQNPHLKHILLMFGSVDYDFSLAKHLWDKYASQDIELKEEYVDEFIQEVISKYNSFLTELIKFKTTPSIIHILAPQVSPMTDRTLIANLRNQNTINTPFPDSHEDSKQQNCFKGEFFSNASRARRTLQANDVLEIVVRDLALAAQSANTIYKQQQIYLHRIDREMVTEATVTEISSENATGAIQERFLTCDHHPKVTETLALWKQKLKIW